MEMTIHDEAVLTPEQLAEAFGAFSSAAQALERSYLSLGQEVARLRNELELERDLRRRREALAEVSALLAHEIRNPLASVELFAGLLAGSVSGEADKGWIAQVQAGLRLVSATVNNILEFHGSGALVLRPLELNSLLRSLEGFLAPLAAHSGVRWETELKSEGIYMHGDRQRLEQVFLNLAMNAFRFAAMGGVLRIRSWQASGQAMIAFEDAGPGIAAEVLGRLFEPGATSRRGGTGLGLAVARRIVEQHGGTISVSSVPQVGTTFRLHLPLPQTGAGAFLPANLEATPRAIGATA